MSSGHDVQEEPTVGLPGHGVEGSARRGKGRSEGEGVVNPEGPRVPGVRVVVVERVRNEIPRRRNRAVRGLRHDDRRAMSIIPLSRRRQNRGVEVDRVVVRVHGYPGRRILEPSPRLPGVDGTRVRGPIDRRHTLAEPHLRAAVGEGIGRYVYPEVRRPGPEGSEDLGREGEDGLPPAVADLEHQLFREIDVANGFAISIHSGFGRGETSLITAFVAAWMEIGNRVTAASGRARSYSSRQSEA